MEFLVAHCANLHFVPKQLRYLVVLGDQAEPSRSETVGVPLEVGGTDTPNIVQILHCVQLLADDMGPGAEPSHLLT